MSYSGYTEFLCASGHRSSRECWDYDPPSCSQCGAPIAWSHSVDTTNGSDDTIPYTIPAPVRLIEYEDVWHEDHYGNRYATKRPRYAPNSREWQRHRRPSTQLAQQTFAEACAAQGTEAGTAETEGLGPKDDGPVAEGDAPEGQRP